MTADCCCSETRYEQVFHSETNQMKFHHCWPLA